MYLHMLIAKVLFLIKQSYYFIYISQIQTTKYLYNIFIYLVISNLYFLNRKNKFLIKIYLQK